MSILKTIRAQLGLSNTAANNFTLDASADDGSMLIARGNAGSPTQTILSVDAAGAVSVATGQLKFPATQNPSADVNTLDDYEEGSWTPVVNYSGSNGDRAHTTQYGRYQKIGNTVHFQMNVIFGETTATGYIDHIAGLPFICSSSSSNGGGALIDNMTGLSGGAIWMVVPSTDRIAVYVSTTGTATVINASSTGAASNRIAVTGSYVVA